MAESKRYAVDPDSIAAYHIRVLFHCEELQRETHPNSRAMIALCLAEAATTLARMEAQEARKNQAISISGT